MLESSLQWTWRIRQKEDFLLEQVVSGLWKWIGSFPMMPPTIQTIGLAFLKESQPIVSLQVSQWLSRWMLYWHYVNSRQVYNFIRMSLSCFYTGLLQRINLAEHPSGYYKTQYKIRRTPNFEKRHDRCVQGFWIAHLRNNT